MKNLVKKLPVVGPIIQKAYRLIMPKKPFPGSEMYWEKRYCTGGNSGDGSYNDLANFKAEVINGVVSGYGIGSVIEFGCGDGNQLRFANYPSYLGFDVSPKAVAICEKRFRDDRSKAFELVADYAGQTADLALSLDVIFHLVEDAVFETYMARLFGASKRLVVIYASNTDDNPDDQPPHVRHRKFSAWVDEKRPDWQLLEYIPNRFPFKGDTKTGSFADFFVYGKSRGTAAAAGQAGTSVEEPTVPEFPTPSLCDVALLTSPLSDIPRARARRCEYTAPAALPVTVRAPRVSGPA